MNRLFAWLAAGGIAGGLLLGALPAEAKESSRRFYDAFRQRGYFEQALDYLDEVRESGSGEAGFREVLDYEAGLTLIDLAHAGHSAAEGEKLLDRADQRLARFLAEHPRHVLAAAAKTQLAGVLSSAAASRPNRPAPSTPRPAAIGRVGPRILPASGDRLPRFGKTVRGRAGQAPPFSRSQRPQAGAADPAVRASAAGLAAARLALARVRGNRPDVSPGTAENQAALREAAHEYADLYDKHRHDLGGLYARLGQARCGKELGQPDRALVMLMDLLAVPGDSEALAVLKTEATRLAMETALAPGVEKYREALLFYEAWRSAAREGEPAGGEATAIQYFAGQAALHYARSLGAAEGAGRAPRGISWPPRGGPWPPWPTFPVPSSRRPWRC